jgi:hypothetical protein
MLGWEHGSSGKSTCPEFLAQFCQKKKKKKRDDGTVE